MIKLKDFAAIDYVLLPEDATVLEALAKTDTGKILLVNHNEHIGGIVPAGKLTE